MPKDTPLKLEDFIIERHLARFLGQVADEEMRLASAAPAIECRRMLKSLCLAEVSDMRLKRLLNAMVNEGYLQEDRKALRVKVVGYFTTSKAIELTEIYQFDAPKNGPVKNRGTAQVVNDSPSLPIPPPDPVLLAIQELQDQILKIESSLGIIQRSIEIRTKKLASSEQSTKEARAGNKYSPTELTRIRLQVRIYELREREELIRLHCTTQRLNLLLDQRKEGQ